MSAFTNPLPPNASLPLSDDVLAHGLQIGVDVAALRNKYMISKLTDALANGSEDQVKVAGMLSDAKRMRDLEARGGPNATPLIDSTSLTSDSSSSSSAAADADADKTAAAQQRLDRLVVCHMCHGQGLRKVHYNYQVRDQNCDSCSGEGLMYKSDTGKLINLSDAPKVDRTYGVSAEMEQKARELAETCGRRTGKEGGDEEALRRDFAIDNGEAPPPVF